jgi:hypothetical protein
MQLGVRGMGGARSTQCMHACKTIADDNCRPLHAPVEDALHNHLRLVQLANEADVSHRAKLHLAFRSLALVRVGDGLQRGARLRRALKLLLQLRPFVCRVSAAGTERTVRAQQGAPGKCSAARGGM